MKTNFNNTPQSYKTSNMTPLDAKAIVNTLDEFKDLGDVNQVDHVAYISNCILYQGAHLLDII